MNTRNAASVLKDVPCSPLEMIKDPSLDQIRMSSYPNLEYQNLYNALTMLLDVASNIQSGLQLFGKAFLQCLGCILPFLDRDLIDNLPYLTASSISVLPSTLHQDIINYLCYYILPFTITRQSDDDQECHACQSVSAVIMLVFQYSTNPAHHCQLLECLMRLKHNVAKDLLCVIGYGTAMSRASAAKLLFYYWPAFDPNLFDRKGLLCKFTNDLVPFVCQRESCPNAGNAEAVKVCYDHCISILYASDAPPPLYLCIECANEIHRDHRNLTFGDILHPMQQVSMVCENKCHGNRHNSRRGIDHIVHRSLPPMMMMDAEMQTYLVESVISLLREAKPLNVDFRKDSTNLESKANASCANGAEQQVDMLTLEERQLLGRYGIWLLVGRCTPTVDTPVEILGRLLSMLFHWFHVTAYSYDGQTESTLEKLKQDHICSWLKEVRISHYKEFIDCLLPHPPEYSRVGGHWDSLASRTSHLKEGLQRLICLIPYEIITQEIWDTVMPHWMEAITNDVPEKELIELKIVLNKILDAEMSPLGFDARAMYNFVAIRFEKTTAKVQQQALYWLQNLTKLEIVIPLPQLFAMFGDGVRIMKHGVQAEINKSKDSIRGGSSGGSGTKYAKERDLQPPRRSSISPVVEDESGNTSAISDDEVPMSKCMEFSTDAEHNLTCCVLMLDILLRQMELQEIEMHSGIYTTVAENVCRLLKCMVTAANVGMGNHSCRLMDCAYCETSVMWHQLSTKLVQYLAPVNPVNPPDPPMQTVIDDEKVRKSPPELEKEIKSNERDMSLSMAPLHIPLGPLGPVPVAVPQPEPHSIMTATVETVSEQLDLAAIMPSEKVVPAVARSVTLSEADVATATVQIAKPNVIGESSSEGGGLDSENLEGSHPFDGDEEFWHTSVGKFKFSIDTLPQSLQFIYQLLKEIPNIDKADILYYVLQCLNVMVLHGDAFVKAARDNRGFFIWCQENMLIKNLWELCTAAQSHICQVTVPTLLHCITLPMGSDVFWKVIQEAFHDADWRVRFEAVERVTVITRFMDSTPLRAEVSLQTSLATAFCHLIAACDDINVHVAQRATLYLGTVHDYAIQALLYCLESQFDKFIIDRPVVLQSIYQLHNSLSDRKVLTWDFFLNRFDTLFVEAQVNLERVGDISYLRDLRNSENGSEILSTKINKAREALSQSDTTGSMSKTLSASFGTKWPYKRTMSAPATIIPRQESKIDGHVHSISGQNEDFHLGSLYRVIDLEEADKETIHLLVFLLMQFMSRPDLAYPTDEKPLFKIQSIVLRHLYLLLGYNQGEKFFHVSPARLRCSSVFNAFMANLPQVLDQNHQMGWLLLPTVIQLLLYAPNQANGAFLPPGASSGTDQNHHNNVVTYNFSIWYLEPHVRRNWLMSLLVILYKYQYNQASMADQVQNLIRLVINSLDAQFHKCRRIPTTIIMDYSATRLRNQSQPSLGTTSELGDEKRTINDSSPPYSPLQTTTLSLYGCDDSSKGRSSRGKAVGKVRKHPDADGDDTESELVVIPESDVSDSTIQESSAQGSLEDTASNDDDSNVLKPDTGGKVKEGLASLSRTNLSIICGAPKIAASVQQHPPQQAKSKKSHQASMSMSLEQADTACSSNANSKDLEKASTTSKPEKPEKTSSNIFRMPSAFQMSSQKCSVQEGVRMMVTSSMLGQPKAQAILNPFANVQKAIVVTQSTSSSSSVSNGSKDVATKSNLPCAKQERLLPIGQYATESVNTIVERVREGLALPEATSSNDTTDDRSDSAASCCHARDVSSSSPRKLTKQSALESPPQALVNENGFGQPEITRKRFYRSVSNSLNDFSELNPTSPIQMLAETLNAKKTLPIDLLPIIFRNLAEYLQCVPIDCIAGSVWLPVIQALDSLLRRVILILSNISGSEHLLDIMVALLKVPQLSKSILEPFSKIISFAIQNLHLTQRVLVEICSLSGRAFAKERDKLYLGRQIVFDLVQALKFKINVPDDNLLLLVGFLLQDAGGILPPGIIGEIACGESFVHANCNISECMRQPYLNDILEFLADFHTLSKIKNLKAPSTTPGLCEDTIGGVLKGAIAQYLALEMSRGNSKDSRTVSKYLPWLNNAPSSLQQGPKEFTECVGHMRLLSWLLMGSLTHTALIVRRIGAGTTAPHQNHLRSSALIIQPVPQEASCHIADHVQVIFAGFAEQSKTSVLHMSSLFHAFTLCQLWTVYLEQVASLAAISSEAYNTTLSVLFEFWAKVTPCILQLVSHSKLSESVNLHFLGLLESLKETRSTILAKLLPLWTPVLSSNTQLSGTLHVRLQNCRDAVPNIEEQDFHASEALLKWLQRLQFKMGQIELQSSTATQFYSI
uniref:Protein unc-79 homolog n=1 Tax=Anopheles culicifacies TaxID=139723 RepID=A0A182M147_9DIPT